MTLSKSLKDDFLDVCCVAAEQLHKSAEGISTLLSCSAPPFFSVMQNVAKKLASFPALEK
jgi:hypothetical protein